MVCAVCLSLLSCLANIFTLMTEAICRFESSLECQGISRYNIDIAPSLRKVASNCCISFVERNEDDWNAAVPTLDRCNIIFLLSGETTKILGTFVSALVLVLGAGPCYVSSANSRAHCLFLCTARPSSWDLYLVLHLMFLSYPIAFRDVMTPTFPRQSAHRLRWCDKSIYKNSVAFSPQTNYNDCTTANGKRNLVTTFVHRGVSRDQRGRTPKAVNFSFLDRSRYFSFK
jgi:hypothetical protein